jgi:ABC-type polysaccharide/polyol phosphate transport system ATPase subunit
MSTGALTVRLSNAGKHFRRVHEKPMLLREAVMLLSAKQQVDDLWAVRHLTFDLREGETLGILGPNGSGKSTLLALVAGAAFPSEGTVSTRGRVSTLLAVGAGFNPDMTGEENILASAGLLGIPVREARRLIPSIVAFAELESAIDTQSRFYSSGMLARLGFAIAINVSPDVLVVDEVLAVGDLSFMDKCTAEVKRLQSSGITIVLASQSPMVVADFCTRAVWLEAGEIKMAGDPAAVGDAYQLAMTGSHVAEFAHTGGADQRVD